ncbi:hypothetical protein [Actinomadura oligospora]|uniref:hypothetical protein n=1 Tax=Actinomadura oligospora TaxID=111804 RepID=UPI00047CF429|nr:hypothetical protein [Actinomadura oligospora]
MMKPFRALAATVLVAAALSPGTGAANATTARGALVLWSQPNQTGTSKNVPEPELEGCAPLDSPFQTRSAANRNTEYSASLFTSNDCTGTPEATIDPGQKQNFQGSHRVSAILFEAP